ncbi:MAG: hypothetical protein ACI85N_001413, partial [Gammaproteobacteria bacterium]
NYCVCYNDYYAADNFSVDNNYVYSGYSQARPELFLSLPENSVAAIIEL